LTPADPSREMRGAYGGTSAVDGLIRVFLSLRALMLIAVAGSLVGSLVMYAAGVGYLMQAIGVFLPAGPEKLKPVVLVLEAMDAFLFGIVLTIFAYGIAFGFVFRLSDAMQSTLPQWMKISGIHQLKQTLAEVVLVVLIVSFAKEVVESDETLTWASLILPIATLLIAGSLAMLRLGAGRDGSH
jgi:uncharacterized membrane protein YqhA